MKNKEWFDIYKNGKFIETVQFNSIEECEKFYPKHFGYKIIRFGSNY